jgi:hypothetical protein
MRTAAELTLGMEPDAVPKSRRFVGSSLAGEPTATVHDVQLTVTELVTNSLLHGEPPVSVRLIHLGTRIRVEVEDRGRALPMPGRQDPESMTGRGLALVAALSSSWGIDAGHRQGKVVWAELPANGTGSLGVTEPEIAPEAVLASQADRPGAPTYAVHLTGIPTALLVAAKAHIDNVVRELTLLRTGQASGVTELAPAMAVLIATVTGEFAEARAEVKQQAAAAAARGDIVTDLELRLPLSYADAGQRYLAALDEADRYARSARLLTMAPPPSHRAFRQWYVGSLVEQLRAVASGRPPPQAGPLAAVLALELDRLGAELDRRSGA